MQSQGATIIAVPFAVPASVAAPGPGWSSTVHLRRGEPLRLNSHAGCPLPAIGDGEDPLGPVRENLLQDCELWNGAARSFVVDYLDQARDRIERATDEIGRGRSTGSGLFSHRDYVFSALRPLPRPRLGSVDETGRSHEVTADFAFWTGHGFVLVDAGPSRLLPPALRRRRSLVEGGGHALFGGSAGPFDWNGLFDALSPGGRFWAGEEIPSGPHPSAALDGLITIAATENEGSR